MAQQNSPRSRGWIGGIAALAVVIVLFFVVRNAFRGKVTVRVATAQYQDIRSTISTNGKVEPIQDFQAPAPMPGMIASIEVHVGQKVAQGQELLRMDDSDERSRVALAEATLASMEATLKNMRNGGTQDEVLGETNDLRTAQTQKQQAATSLAALQALQAKGAASANEVAAAQQKVQDAQTRVSELQTRRTSRYSASDIATQEEQVAQARAALRAAESALNSVDIRAPFSGTVYSVPVEPHDFVQTGNALMNVADLNRLQVRAYFDEPEIGTLSVGQRVRIVWDARPKHEWHGHIEQAPSTIIEYRGTRQVGECVITVDDANGDLLPNTNVTVTVITEEKPHVLSIPREALHTDGRNNYVYKIVNGRLVKTSITPGVVNLVLVEVAQGLAAGDTVALAATSEAELSDGLEVKAQP